MGTYNHTLYAGEDLFFILRTGYDLKYIREVFRETHEMDQGSLEVDGLGLNLILKRKTAKLLIGTSLRH